MANDSRDEVRAILAETRRRKRVWAEMQRTAREALEAVTAVARRRGIRGQNWMGGSFDSEYVFVDFPTNQSRLEAAMDTKRSRYHEPHSFQLHGSGTIERPNKDDTYEGYPNLVDGDVQYFRRAAVHTLMASLNAYTQRTGRRQQPRRRR